MIPFPMDAAFGLVSEPATYTPPAGAPLSCRAKRIGNGEAISVGRVQVTAETSDYHVLRSEVPAPVAGGTLIAEGATVTIDVVEPLPDDPQNTRWLLRGSWGVDTEWLRPSEGAGPAYPPMGEGFTIAAAVLGATAVTLDAPFVKGQVKAGDTFTIEGDAQTYTIQADKTAATSGFVNLSIAPGLAVAAAGGEAVTFTFNGGAAPLIRTAIADYEASEVFGGVRAGDRRLVVRAGAVASAGRTRVEPGDVFTIAGAPWTAVTASAVYVGTTPAAWDVQVRR
jgi:hypothetical protein